MEIWKKIKGFENYEVSNFGNVKRNESLVLYSNGNICKHKYKILKKELSKGYERVTLSNKNIQKRFLVHRIVALMFISNLENKNYVNHIDGNKKNNHILNLEWCTSSENEIHSYKVLNKINSIRKLKTEDVKFIKKNGVKGLKGNVKYLAFKFKVDSSTILNVLNEKYYV